MSAPGAWVHHLFGQLDQVPRNLLAPFDRARAAGHGATSVGGHGRIGVDDGDESGDVLGLPSPLELADDAVRRAVGVAGDMLTWSD